jgi:hypothetical protein
MTIKNNTNNKIICENIRRVKNEKDKVLGLIGSNNNQGLLMNTRFGIHTLFMKISIDVLVLDQNQKVVKIKENLKPFRIFFWNPKFSTIIELPTGIIENTKTKIGDLLEITK